MLQTVLLMLFLLVTTAHCKSCPDLFEEISKIKAAKINYRLPQNIRPIRYYITLEPRLEPNLNPAPFTGAVTIELQPEENTKNITLHTRQLNITESSISITDSNGEGVEFTNTSRDDEREFYIIHLDTPLLQGKIYNLTIGHYVGILHLDNGGFYLAKYYDNGGKERRFATTQFQSTNARKSFPCFDEPHMKASFIVQLIRNVNTSTTSISNQELLYTTNMGNGRYMDTYKETIKMSTYLAAFVVTDYIPTNTTQRQRVFADKEAVDAGQAEYALQVGIDILNAMENFVGVNYSLNKIDQIAIPDDYFAPGAMENWGLVTYRKSYLVYPIETATTSELRRTVTIVAHEFAHQWFGNLVTCSWWRYIWLNEGFANYFESFASSLIRPSWRFMDQFVLTSVQSSFQSDSLNSTKPMNSETDYPGGGPPTHVAYQKAGSVIRMFEHFLTASVFRRALNVYLTRNAFQPVEPSDLYQALQEVADSEITADILGNLTVSDILKTWDSQAGYPVVNVTRDYKTGYVTLHQERFFLKDLSAKDNNTWYIPINYVFNAKNASDFNKTTADFWLTQKIQTLKNDFPNTSWLIINKLQTGYYRVNYDEINWNRIITHLNTANINVIHVINRAQLLDDAFNLARAGKLHYYIPLNLSQYLAKETDYVPVTAFLNAATFLNTMLAAAKEYGVFEKYINDMLAGAFEHLGLEPKTSDEYLDKSNRINVLNWLCDVGNWTCRNHSLEKVRAWKADSPSTIDPDLETPVFCGAMRIGNQNDWNFLYQKYETAGNTSQRTRLLNGLTCSENKTILNGLLDKVSDNNSTLRVGDRYLVFRNLLNAGNFGLRTAFEYVDKNYEKLKYKVNIPALLGEIGAKYTTDVQLNELIIFANKHNEESGTFEAAINNAKENIEWNNKFAGNILDWLNDYANSYS